MIDIGGEKKVPMIVLADDPWAIETYLDSAR